MFASAYSLLLPLHYAILSLSLLFRRTNLDSTSCVHVKMSVKKKVLLLFLLVLFSFFCHHRHCCCYCCRKNHARRKRSLTKIFQQRWENLIYWEGIKCYTCIMLLIIDYCATWINLNLNSNFCGILSFYCCTIIPLR